MKKIEKSKKIKIATTALLLVIIIILIRLITLKGAWQIATEESEKVAELELQNFLSSITVWDGTSNSKVTAVDDGQGGYIPVPIGYTASEVDGENSIDTGFVIYEGTTAVTSENVADARINRNQWVWIPVDDIDDIYGVNSSGYALGKLYDFSSSGRTRCNWNLENGIMTYPSSSGYREPLKNLTGSYVPDYLSEETEAYNTDFANMIKSVATYGGFYIGRYETGGLSSTATVTAMNTDIASQTWTTMESKCKTLAANSNVTTSIIWGCLYDRTLQWLVDTGCKTYSEVGSDSSDWGNYYNSTFTYTNTSGGTSTKGSNYGTVIPTGSTEYTNANNIYDLAGNVAEWTNEAYRSSYRVCRGSYYSSYNTGSNYPADYRSYSSTSYSYAVLGCRARTLRRTVRLIARHSFAVSQ